VGVRALPEPAAAPAGIIAPVSAARQQAFIDAPVEVVWDLLEDVDRHPQWWPRVVEVECEGLEAGCTYREVVQTPLGKDEMLLRVDLLDECKELLIRCVNTGTFVHMLLTEAQDGTFVDAEFGMEPDKMRYRIFDAVAGRRYFRSWLRQSIEAMQRVAGSRARSDAMGDPGLEPGTSSLSERRSNRLS
jgi:Polyketide cyclase / dehydrase and lipid transport